jgi:hypothetical protein
MPVEQDGNGVERALSARMDRRRFIKLAGVAGAAAGLAPILAACGGDGEEAR